jgi:hypothetical protein
MFLSNQDERRKSYRGPSIELDASYTILLYLTKEFQRFLESDQPKTRIAYGALVC